MTQPRATLRLPTTQGTSFADSATASEGMPDADEVVLRRAWSETKYDLRRRCVVAYCFELVDSLL